MGSIGFSFIGEISISSIVTDVVTYPVVKVRSPEGDPAAATWVGTGPSDPLVGGLRWELTDQGIRGGSGLRTRDDGSRTSLRTVVRCAELATRRSSRDSTRVIRLSSVDLAQVFVLRWPDAGVVETRRLELLTLSLQRRCSAN